MAACVLDTNAVVYYLNRYGGEGFRARFQDMVRTGSIVSVVTRIEVLGWRGYAETAPALADAKALLSLLREEPLTDRIVEATIALRRVTRLRVPDAIIAATHRFWTCPWRRAISTTSSRLPACA